MKQNFVFAYLLLIICFGFETFGQSEKQKSVLRFVENPIVTPAFSISIGENINGPSLIKVPDWVSNPLGKYYLYFAHHNGKFIRLAYADNLKGPWKIYEPGTLNLSQTICSSHIASPDAHIDEATKEIRMYFHGPVKNKKGQYSFFAYSKDGINFSAGNEILGESYFRVFNWNKYYYAVAKGGEIYRSADGKNNFEYGGNPFPDQDTNAVHIRHVALDLSNDTLSIYYSNIGDAPESIVMAKIILSGDWKKWKAIKPVVIIKSEFDYEGSELPIKVSNSGAAKSKLHELRDPAVYKEGNKTYLLYSVAGESGIAIAELRN